MGEQDRIFHFHSDAISDDELAVSGMTGVESLSNPYEFELTFASKKADLPLEKILSSKAWLSVRQSVPVSGGKRGTRVYKFHGIVRTAEMLEKENDWVRYRVEFVPRLWRLSLRTACRVFQDVDIKALVKQVFEQAEGAELTAEDLEFKTGGSFEKHEFIVQYNETDLDFLHRWLEHEGVAYYFTQTESGEKVVFFDSPSAYATLPGDPPGIPYRPRPESRSRASGAESEESLQEECILSFTSHFVKSEKQVVLKDYNYRTPSVAMKGSAPVPNPAGEGTLYLYGEHFKTPAAGNATAKVRAEEIRCRNRTFEGKGDHRSFRPGTKFTLSEHFSPAYNAPYAIVRVEHTMTQGTGAASGAGSSMVYANEFTCIPADVVFRPEDSTPWPSIAGVVNATIDAAGSGQYAEIDDQGRYKVKLPFDLSDKKDGKASRYVRMAQPYSGPGMGMHFPLHKGTEVLLAFVDGDPDRPIIVGSIPNAETAGPVSGGNQSQCAIHTGGGNKIVIEDTAGGQRICFSSPTAGTTFSIGAPPG